MTMTTVTGRILSVGFTAERGDGLFEIYLDGHPPRSYQVLGNEGAFIADGNKVTYPELMAWFVSDDRAISATLHPVLERYEAVLSGEFARC